MKKYRIFKENNISNVYRENPTDESLPDGANLIINTISKNYINSFYK